MLDYSAYKAEDFLLEESFIQYCKGNEEATEIWETVLTDHPKLIWEINRAKDLYAALSTYIDVTATEKESQLQRFKLAVANEKQQHLPPPPAVVVMPVKKKWSSAILVAAVVIGVIITGALFYNKTSQFDINNTPVSAFAQASYGQVIQSQPDQRREVTLPDGSQVTLNYGSTIKIASDFNVKQRWVFLEGEAFFSVKPDKTKPFVVITGKNATSALGTSFKVRNYPGETSGDVMLATGKVKVQSMLDKSTRGDVILMPGEKATSEKLNLPLKSSFDLTVLQNWRTLKIDLDKANLEQIIAALEFYYGVQVTLQSKPENEIAFTGKFDNESLQSVLEAISFTNKFSYTQHGNTVSILFR